MEKYRIKKDVADNVWYLQRKIMNEHYKMQWVIIADYNSLNEAKDGLNTKISTDSL